MFGLLIKGDANIKSSFLDGTCGHSTVKPESLNTRFTCVGGFRSPDIPHVSLLGISGNITRPIIKGVKNKLFSWVLFYSY